MVTGPPLEEEEVTNTQLAALAALLMLLRPPFVDFAVWTPFGDQIHKNQKFAVYVPVGNGEYEIHEIPGPESFKQWQACWRVFRTAAIMLRIARASVLDAYEKRCAALVATLLAPGHRWDPEQVVASDAFAAVWRQLRRFPALRPRFQRA